MTNIKLSKRLKCIADMIEVNSIIADIGCDHALLDIYLSQNKIIKKAVACDITEGALSQAKKNISINGINNIDTRLADGLDAINEKDEINTIVMSGLGDQKIIKILNDGINKLKGIEYIIIQSNTGVDKIRSYLTKNNYYIEDEKLIKERDIIYTVIKFKKGFKKYSAREIFYGPILLKNKDLIFNEMLKEIINKNNNIIKRLPNTKIFKKIKLYINNIELKREMIK